MIKDHDVIFIDAGTTNELLVQEIVNPTVTVVTNSIHHATKLVERNVPTVIIGGKVKSSTDASIGGIALNQIGQLNFDKAFLGMNGIDDEFTALQTWKKDLSSVRLSKMRKDLYPSG